ncbi:MAG TPA: response regulator [Planctomycetota bacterium]
MDGIVIIEDEPDLVELYRLVLEGAGHDVVGTFEDPRVPLGKPPPELDPEVIVLDERLHGLSGMSFLPRLRGTFPRAKILFASADPDAIERSVLEGADLAMQKPFIMIKFLEAIRRLRAT